MPFGRICRRTHRCSLRARMSTRQLQFNTRFPQLREASKRQRGSRTTANNRERQDRRCKRKKKRKGREKRFEEKGASRLMRTRRIGYQLGGNNYRFSWLRRFFFFVIEIFVIYCGAIFKIISAVMDKSPAGNLYAITDFVFFSGNRQCSVATRER